MLLCYFAIVLLYLYFSIQLQSPVDCCAVLLLCYYAILLLCYCGIYYDNGMLVCNDAIIMMEQHYCAIMLLLQWQCACDIAVVHTMNYSMRQYHCAKRF